MDPFTAIGLSLNVIELGKLCWKTAGFCITCYKYGTEPQFQDTYLAAQDLKDSSTKLQNALNSCPTPITPGDRDLQRICHSCCDIARKVDVEIENLKFTPGTWKAFRTGFKIPFKMKKIEELRSTMDEQMMILHTRILVDLR